ncbi:MAG TPA: hypothetical protein VK009_27980 [Chloroflexota bacterium]|nr:hypothetical protein [Chloroflexota bacterium]
MFQAIAIVISLAGMAAIIYTIVGAVSGRSLHIGLILAGFILALQVFALGYSAITDPPQDKSSAQDAPTPGTSDAASPASASVSLQLG